MRTITLYTTYGKIEKIETDVTTWGELEKLAISKGIDTDKLLATEGVRKTDLNHSEAILPEGPFTVFFRKKETKAGLDSSEVADMAYRDLRNTIAGIIAEDVNAKSHFSGNKSYTNKSTTELKSLLVSYLDSQNELEIEEEDESESKDNTEAETKTQEIVTESLLASTVVQSCISTLARVVEAAEVNGDVETAERVQIAIEELEGVQENSDLDYLVDGATISEVYSTADINRPETEEQRLAREFAELQARR
jgi:hypothetical protein